MGEDSHKRVVGLNSNTGYWMDNFSHLFETTKNKSKRGRVLSISFLKKVNSFAIAFIEAWVFTFHYCHHYYYKLQRSEFGKVKWSFFSETLRCNFLWKDLKKNHLDDWTVRFFRSGIFPEISVQFWPLAA